MNDAIGILLKGIAVLSLLQAVALYILNKVEDWHDSH